MSRLCLNAARLGLLCALAICIERTSFEREPLEAEAREYLGLATALGLKDGDSLDYDYYAPSREAGARVDDAAVSLTRFASIGDAAVALARRIESVPSVTAPSSRRNFLLSQLQAVAARARALNGSPLRFEAETYQLFGVSAPTEFATERVAALHDALRRLLPGDGPLATRYRDFDAKFAVPAERLRVVMARAVEACRARTLAHMPLPPGESVQVEYVHDRPWSGFSRYQGNYQSVVQINADFPLTVDRALELACHEAYPGHHTYNTLREMRLVRDGRRIEYAAQLTYSPQSLMSEATAAIAAEIAFPDQERLRFERDVLFPLAGLDPQRAEIYLRVARLIDELRMAIPVIAQRFLDGTLEFARASAQLENTTLMVHPEATLKFLNRYRSYVVTYTWGRDRAREWVRQRSREDDGSRWTAYEQLLMADTF